MVRFVRFSLTRALIVNRVSEASSPRIPPIMISHVVFESPRNAPDEFVGGVLGGVLEQLDVHAPKASSNFGALASFGVSDGVSSHAASIVDK
jgi:hypothetical protein